MPDQPAQVMIPLSPTKMIPLFPSPRRCLGSLGSIPGGVGGRRPPSYQCTVTGTLLPRAAKRQVTSIPGRAHLRVHAAEGRGLDGLRRVEVERVIRRVEVVDREVGQRSAPERPVSPPAERRVGRVVGARLAGAEPHVPVEAGRHVRRCPAGARVPSRTAPRRPRSAPRGRGRWRRPRSTRTIWRCPSLEWPWLPIWVATPVSRATRAIDARFGDVVRQGLLAVDVLARLHRRDRDVGVEVVGGGDEDGVDRLLLLQHHPEVLVHGAGVVGGSWRGRPPRSRP